MNSISEGLCHCGCGTITSLAVQTNNKIGVIKGKPMRFVIGHNIRLREKEDHWNWLGGRNINNSGYIEIKTDFHHRVTNRGYVLEHILIAEKILGKPLSPKSMIHHIDEDKTNNTRSNLVICEDIAYHKLLHRRMRAYKACGHANWRKCGICHQYDSTDNLSRVSMPKQSPYHKSCAVKYQKRLRALAIIKKDLEEMRED
mgnify:CR=1 FL=1